MKNRYTSLDVVAALQDMQAVVGMRVHNVYDINSKTYLIRLKEKDRKAVVLIESGIRVHLTEREWEKNQFPSGFSMKLRKHAKNSRLKSVKQVGVDRVLNFTFGEGQEEVHVIVELYDHGNILLADKDFTILNILRPRTDKDTDVKYSVRERYPIELARQDESLPSREAIEEALKAAQKGQPLRRLLTPLVLFGAPLLEHVLKLHEFPNNAQIDVHVKRDDTLAESLDTIMKALEDAQNIYTHIKCTPSQGFLTYKSETSVSTGDEIRAFQEYHPFRFSQITTEVLEFNSFSMAVDEFYAHLETQKADQKSLTIERDALKKLDNVKRDQEMRIKALEEAQRKQELMGERVALNQVLVEKALTTVKAMVSSQISWAQMDQLRIEAASNGDPIASSIVKLQLDKNQFIMRLFDPYSPEEPPLEVPMDIRKTYHQNASRFFTDKKAAAVKQEKTIKASAKAVKNAQAKTKDTMELVKIRKDVAKSRKAMWFEKFMWFISSENYIVVGGRDHQQNDMIVKKYLRPGDIYMHADIRGAASVVVRNKPGRGDIPPKTLHEAAQMAICYSNAWDAKVISNAWWVRHDQVSRTAPTGEYLPSGSFMIRGKKNFMPTTQLVMGFGIFFKLDEESVLRHKGERRVLTQNEEVDDLKRETETEEKEEEVEQGGSSDEEEQKNGEGDEEFPDVTVSVAGLQVKKDGDEEYTIIEIGPKNVGRGRDQTLDKHQETKKYLEEKQKELEKQTVERSKRAENRLKRKQKLIKKKYGDQDEEERMLRMQALGIKVPAKIEEIPIENETEVQEQGQENKEESKEKGKGRGERNQQQQEQRRPKEENVDLEPDDDEKEEEVVEDSDALLDTLTGKPVEDDVLLYAVAVVAPYNALSQFKFKVKLTPGTGKRGKAAKSALELFMRSKEATPREVALVRSLVGDEAAARNVPGKVRVSAPQLHSK